MNEYTVDAGGHVISVDDIMTEVFEAFQRIIDKYDGEYDLDSQFYEDAFADAMRYMHGTQ